MSGPIENVYECTDCGAMWGGHYGEEQHMDGCSGNQKPERQITLTFDDKTYQSIRSAVFVRGLSAGGEFNGVADQFLGKLIQLVEKGETTWHVKTKRDPT